MSCVFSRFAERAIKRISGAHECITLYGDGLQTRSFCYVDDLVDGLIRLMDSPADVIGPINLGNPSEMTICMLAETVVEMTGSRLRIEYRPLPSDDPRQRKPDITRAQQALGWSPSTVLREGLAKTITYFDTLLSAGDGKPERLAAVAAE